MGGKLSFLLLLAFFNLQISESVDVKVYYETYNEHVRKFITEQFAPLVDRLDGFAAGKLNLKVFPYGRTTPENGCPLGCDGNNIHACAMYTSGTANDINDYNVKDVSAFVRCFFKNRFAMTDANDLTKDCMKDGKIDFAAVSTCTKDADLIKTLTAAMATATDAVKDDIKTSGLAIQIGDEAANAAAQADLLGEVCKNPDLNGEQGCQNLTPLTKVKLAVFYEARDLDAGRYFNKQLFPYYHVLEDFVDIELLPYGMMKYDIANYACPKDSGEASCISNVFQAVVIDKYMGVELNGDIISGANRVINFVSCLYHQDTTANVYNALQMCSNDNLEADEYASIMGTINTKPAEFKAIIDKLKKRTEDAKIPRIPYVTVGGTENINAFNDLIQEACAKYMGPQKSTICNPKQKVSVLYNPLDHKTRTVFLEGVKQIFDNLQNLVDFDFVPAGATKLTATRKFDCSPEACKSMELHACVYDNYWNTGVDYVSPVRQDAFDVIQCMFKNKAMKQVEDSAEICSELIDGWFDIETCLKQEGDSGLGENIKKTDGLLVAAGQDPTTFKDFPAFIIGDQEKKLVKDVEALRTELCNGIDTYHQPDFCLKGFAKKIPVKVFYQSDSELSKYFFTTQYDPWYLNIEEMVDIQLVPGGDSGDPPAGDCNKKFDADSPCFGNMIQAYVIASYQNNPNANDWIDGTMRTMHFMRCVFSHPLWRKDYITSSEDCAEQHLGADDFDFIQAVKANEDGFYKTALQTTDQFRKDAGVGDAFGLVPWVAVGDKKDHSKRAADDLLQTICSMWEGDKPRECTPVNIEVYYSGFHPQSRRFFVDELIPVFRNLRERIHLDLIPYGTLKNEDTECATSACKVNKHHACAIKKYFGDEVQENTIQWDGKNQTLMYIHCMFKNVKNSEIAALSEDCAKHNIVQSQEIHTCAQGADGIAYLKEMRTRTENVNLVEEMDVTPWVVINGKRIAAAQTDLRKVICDELSNAQYGDLPDYCIGERATKVALQILYSTLDEDSQKYFLNELYPNYRSLEEIMDLDLISLGECSPLEIPGHNVVKCPGHDDEAHATLIHACVNEMFWKNDDGPVSDNNRETEFDGKLQVLEFLKCYFQSQKYPETPGEAAADCVEATFGDIWGEVDTCARGAEGFNILKGYQKDKVAYLTPSMKYTPWITVNGGHNYAVENHIKRTVCDAFQGAEKPLDCYDPVMAAEKPVVEVHYEVDDPKSVNFFTKFFNAEKISQLAIVNFIPFGRSMMADGKFTCKNDEECHKYRQHVCLIDLFYKTLPISTLKTIACTFKADKINTVNALNECFDDSFPDTAFDTIITCQKDTEASDKLLTAAANAASALNKQISHSPWIVINGEHNLEAELNKGLADEICAEYYPNDKPKECQVPMLPVGVYYQTRDADVAKFFSEQLVQQAEYLTEIGDFDFVPYGKTTQNADGTFKCPADTNNKAQCEANMIHACAVNHVAKTVGDKTLNQIRLARFLVCTFTTVAPSYLRYLQARDTSIEEKCGKDAFPEDIWREFHDCATDPQVAKPLMESMKKKTEDAKIGDALPEIIINKNTNAQSRSAFFQTLCNAYDSIRPPLCRTMENFGVPAGIYFSGDKASQDYFNAQIKPLYYSVAPLAEAMDDNADEQLYRLITPDLVPWGTTKYNADAEAKDRFTCTGENECYINRFFACAVSAHKKEPRAKLHFMELAVCFFSKDTALTDPAGAFAICTSAIWTTDPYVELNECAKSPEAFDQKKLLVMKDLTEQIYPVLTSYPSITIRETYNDEATKGKLFKVLCSEYQGLDKPAACANDEPPGPGGPTTEKPSTGSAVSVFASSVILLIASLFVLTQF